MKTRLSVVTLAAAGMLAAAAAAQTAAPPHRNVRERLADRQIAFADKLHADGEEAYALLEYRRFLFHHPDHPRAGSAARTAAKLYIGYVDNSASARRLLNELVAEHPGTPAADKAAGLLSFIKANDDYDGRPLHLLMAGSLADERGDPNEAVSQYDLIGQKYSKSALADAALLAMGKVYLQDLDNPAEAEKAFQRLLQNHPRSPLASDAAYQRAVALEEVHGGAPQVRQAYQQVVRQYPNTDAAGQASDRLDALDKGQTVLKRRHAMANVKKYTVLKEGYLERNDRYEVIVNMAAGLKDAAVEATLEDALLAHYRKRKRQGHDVRVEGYTNYPADRAGTVSWTPGHLPQYTVQKKEGDDLKDTLIDILKNL